MSAEEDKLFDEVKDMFQNGDEKDRQAILRGMQMAGQKWLTDKEFEEHYEFGKKIASDQDDDGETMMQFWLYGTPHDSTSKEKKAVVPVLLADWPPDNMSKTDAMKALGIMFADKFPDHMLTTVVQISEAWSVQRDNNGPEEDNHIAPSDSPNKVEIVFVSAMSMDQRHSWWQAEILRDDKGKFKSLGNIKEEKYQPGKPSEYKEMKNVLSAAIFMGNGLVKRKNMEEAHGKIR